MRNYFAKRKQVRETIIRRDNLLGALLAADAEETEKRIAAQLGPKPTMTDVMELWSAWERGNA